VSVRARPSAPGTAELCSGSTGDGAKNELVSN